jgi:hypothetical protein
VYHSETLEERRTTQFVIGDFGCAALQPRLDTGLEFRKFHLSPKALILTKPFPVLCCFVWIVSNIGTYEEGYFTGIVKISLMIFVTFFMVDSCIFCMCVILSNDSQLLSCNRN